MDELKLEYCLEDAGWAEVKFSNSKESISRPVSYLHDSLLDLANVALNLKKGSLSCRAVFMDEPGEYQLILNEEEKSVYCEIRQYKDWESWDMWATDDFILLLKGVTSPENIINEVSNILSGIHKNIGPEKYKELWVEHEFPITAFNELASA